VAASPERPDYYQILQVAPDAHPEVIRSAYRTLLRVLGKHPDLGGDTGEARRIIDAYATLRDPRRREAYDQWLRVHGRPTARPPAAVPAEPELPPSMNWLRAALPEYTFAFRAPFARSFDLVLERPTWLAPRVYGKAFAQITRAQWPLIFVLCEAIRVARRGLLPSSDTIVLAAPYVEEMPQLLREAWHHSAHWAWSRTLIAVCTLDPPRVHRGRIVVPSAALRCLESRLPGIPR
jgi:hypothetical protein